MNPSLVQTALVVVFYHPTEEQTARFVRLSEAMRVIAVDNSDTSRQGPFPSHFTYIPLGQNRGIAAAQNCGIREAEALGVRQIIFFDQDSAVSVSLVEQLIAEYTRIRAVCPRLAVVGPRILDIETGKPYKMRQDAPGDGFYRVPTVISSGSVIELATLKEVGGMLEELYIDGVDSEWCWRAQSKGYACCVTQHVELLHKVGQKQRHLLGQPILIAAPMRYYYIYRNLFLLCRLSHIPTKWKLKSCIRRLVEAVYVPCVARQKGQTLRNILRGIADGIRH